MPKRHFRRKQTLMQSVTSFYPLYRVTNLRFWRSRVLPRPRGSSWSLWFMRRVSIARLKGDMP